MEQFLAISFALSCLWPGLAEVADTVSIKPGMPFVEARKHLIDHRWKPRKTPNTTERFAVAKMLLRQGVSEVESCSVDSFCIFRYVKGRQCLKLVAHGETLQDLTVVQWDHVCP